MRKFLSFVFTLCLFMGTIVPARAVEVADPAPPAESETVPPSEVEDAPVVVGTLEELQAAIDSAEDGDTISVSSTIQLQNQSIDTEKSIVLVRADNFENHVFSVGGMCKLSGLTIVDNQSSSAIMLIECNTNDGQVIIENCHFVGDGNWNSYMINIFNGSVALRDCIFENSEGTALSTSSFALVEVDGCKFFNNSTIFQGGAICNYGTLNLENSTIQENRAGVGGGIYNAEGANISIRNCEISGNTTDEKFYGSDILSLGSLDIDEEQDSSAGFYEETTGEKITLPLSDCTTLTKLVYLEDDAAEEYFAIEWIPVDPAPVIPMTPIEPAPIIPAIPIEPAPIIPATPLEPSQKPDNGGEDTDDDYTPPDDYKPSHKPSKPHKPVDTTLMEDIKPAPVLTCGDAVIDISRSVVLEGYGDGLLHLDDPLTRAQMATIIFRLLDADSIDVYGDTELVFVDVPAEAWYFPYVSAIARAGIVYGVGDNHYNPDGQLTWAHILTVLGRFVEPQKYALQNINYEGWALPSVETACAIGWIEDNATFAPDAIISRGEFVALVNGVIAKYR